MIRNFKNQSGFTFLEIMITLSLVVILISASSVGVEGFLAFIKLEEDRRQLYSQILKARQLAIIDQQNYGILFKPKKSKYLLLKEDLILETSFLNKGIVYRNINFGPADKITFTSLGTARGGNVEIENSNGRSYKIIVSPHTGRVRYERYN